MKCTSFQESSSSWADPVAPRRHSRETNSVLNDVEQLSVGELLGRGQAHIGSRRIQILSHDCIAAAVIGVTRETMIRPMRARLRENFRAVTNGIRPGFRVGRHGHGAGFPGHPTFHRRRLIASAESPALPDERPGRLRAPRRPRRRSLRRTSARLYTTPLRT